MNAFYDTERRHIIRFKRCFKNTSFLALCGHFEALQVRLQMLFVQQISQKFPVIIIMRNL